MVEGDVISVNLISWLKEIGIDQVVSETCC
jgi:hypothetical protein